MRFGILREFIRVLVESEEADDPRVPDQPFDPDDIDDQGDVKDSAEDKYSGNDKDQIRGKEEVDEFCAVGGAGGPQIMGHVGAEKRQRRK